jgi:hypothetical protein
MKVGLWVVSVGLLIMASYAIWSGKAWSGAGLRPFSRAENPVMYWLSIGTFCFCAVITLWIAIWWPHCPPLF